MEKQSPAAAGDAGIRRDQEEEEEEWLSEETVDSGSELADEDFAGNKVLTDMKLFFYPMFCSRMLPSY